MIHSENFAAKQFREDKLYIQFASDVGVSFTISATFFQPSAKPLVTETYMQNAIISQKWDEIRQKKYLTQSTETKKLLWKQ